MFNDLMLDLETLGTRAGCPVVAVGACFFDIQTGEIGQTFDAAIDITDALRFGKADGDTFKWWLTQSDEARQKVARGRHSTEKVMSAFWEFVSPTGGIRPSLRAWSNGASFDVPIIEYTLGRSIAKTCPWEFWNVRDCRTIKDIGNALGYEFNGQRKGVHHSALDDAIFQAEWTSFYWRKITERAKPASLDVDDLLG